MKRIIYLFCLLVSINLACSTQLPTDPQSVNTDFHAYTSGIISEPTETNKVNQMIVCRAGNVEDNEGLNVRSSAGTDNAVNVILSRLSDGILVTLTGRERTLETGVYTWYEISSPASGWVNAKYLCDGE